MVLKTVFKDDYEAKAQCQVVFVFDTYSACRRRQPGFLLITRSLFVDGDIVFIQANTTTRAHMFIFTIMVPLVLFAIDHTVVVCQILLE